MARTPDRIVGTVDVEIFARHGDTEHHIGTVPVPIRLNIAVLKREVQAAFNDHASNPEDDTAEDPS